MTEEKKQTEEKENKVILEPQKSSEEINDTGSAKSVLDAVFSEVAKKKEEKKVETKTSKKTSKKIKGKKKKVVKHVAVGNAYVQATYNNTIISFTDQNGNVIGWSSAGKCGFKGPKKATPYAAGVIVRDAVERVKESGLRDVHVFVKGVGLGREAAVRALNAQGINVMSIQDVTPIPHNGCRQKKPRRV